MKDERAQYIAQIRTLNGDIEGRLKALETVRSSDVWVYGEPAPFPYVPYLFNAKDRAYIADQCTTMHAILTKVIQRYLDDAGYRELFHFSDEKKRLILLPCDYEQLLPIGRFDLFLDEDSLDYKFCEFNTDGSGAMSRDYMIGTALMQGETFKRFAQNRTVRQFELFDSWVEAFMNIYNGDAHACPNPTIAVTDFRESGVMSDFARFIEAFRRAGYDARFTDIRDFTFDGEHLIDSTDGHPIHAIYRRAVTSEILQHPGECDGFIDAIAARAVCLIGHFRTTVVHSKEVNIALFDKRTRDFLTPQECDFIDAHVPHTYRLEKGADGLELDKIKKNRESWIIKPADDYGAHGVYPGIDFSQTDWERLVDENLDAGYIVQEFYQPPRVDIVNSTIDEKDPCKVESWQSMPGVYLYDGKPVGFYCRLGNEGVIAIDHNGLCANSFAVD